MSAGGRGHHSGQSQFLLAWPDTAPAAMMPDLGQGWTERMLFDTVATVVPGARAVLCRLVEVGGTAS